MTMHYWIENDTSGADLGTWAGDTEAEALDAMAQAAGYASHWDWVVDQRLEIAQAAGHKGWYEYLRQYPSATTPNPGADLTIRCLEEEPDALAEFVTARAGLDPHDEDDGPAFRAVLAAIERGLVEASDEGIDRLASHCRWWRAEDGIIYPTEASRVEPQARRLSVAWAAAPGRSEPRLEFDDPADLDI